MVNDLLKWLLAELLKEAADPAVKAWIVTKLKDFDSTLTNDVEKILLEALISLLS